MYKYIQKYAQIFVVIVGSIYQLLSTVQQIVCKDVVKYSMYIVMYRNYVSTYF